MQGLAMPASMTPIPGSRDAPGLAPHGLVSSFHPSSVSFTRCSVPPWRFSRFIVSCQRRAPDPSAAISLCERWRMSLSRPADGDGAVAVGVSIGIALFRAGEETIEETVRRADGALYEAKRQGRNRVVQAEA